MFRRVVGKARQILSSVVYFARDFFRIAPFLASCTLVVVILESLLPMIGAFSLAQGINVLIRSSGRWVRDPGDSVMAWRLFLRNVWTLWPLGLATICVVAAKVLAMQRRRLQGCLGDLIGIEAERAKARKMLELDSATVHSKEFELLEGRARFIGYVSKGAIESLMASVAALVGVMVAGVLLARLSVWLVMILVLLVVPGVAISVCSNHLEDGLHERFGHHQLKYLHLLDMIRQPSVRLDLSSNARGRYFLGLVTKNARIWQRETNAMRLRTGWRLSLVCLVDLVARLVIDLWLIWLVLSDPVFGVGGYVFFAALTSGFMMAMQSLASELSSAHATMLKLGAYYTLLKLAPRHRVIGGRWLDVGSEGLVIEFRDVWFTYPETTRPALAGVNLILRAGELVEIRGGNGCGKSTLLALLTRQYQPDRGEILVNGCDLATYDLDSWREVLSVMFQASVVYPVSLKENVVMGDGARVEDAVRAALLDDQGEFVDGLPAGLATELSSGSAPADGVRLSGGEAQRVQVARTLLRGAEPRARVFVFDEPTASLDADMSRRVFAALRGLADAGYLCIVVTHAEATGGMADRVMIMHQGKVVAGAAAS